MLALTLILELTGALVLLYQFVFKPARFVINLLCECDYLCRTSDKYLKPPGGDAFAVITGATDGIGLEYARQLASRGYSILLLSRSEERLKYISHELKFRFGYRCKQIDSLTVDFSEPDIYEQIQEKLDSLEGRIHILVNNVGVAPRTPEYFHQPSSSNENFHRDLIYTNIMSTTRMTEMVLKIMLKQDHDKSMNPARGIIINLSSFFGLTETPLVSSYSASKAYIRYFSNILATEYAKDDVLVQTVCPNHVDTKMIKNANFSPFVVGAKKFVEYALSTVGTEQLTSGHPWHKVLNGLYVFGDILGHSNYMKAKYFLYSKYLSRDTAPK